ncbi:MAG: LssY C-terminal domain-containing protein [Pseudodesulfovibrio sp.]|uniref:MarR family transcriptional regulator n=1 Tax=Pseudodesulfovibrio aespoeensis (strain ATCC 700646 / DSM 10631 / Aspo-2) TaxID=643562 RepID=E6VW83_PSEA9|nr:MULTISPECIES: MarR family transcriptional regulator [Pseudodesulfovibrio]MBU4193024.1 LssY C-terminal domain-containing protein [Pseudomonadota bacterium]ADU63643.1 MarR family transcriptional regulator [Pseudodesulfovibrio aespoeensis Aspo-2]MBU4244927.1 LssY C-terminal domain-containing protein [Pseudomonadota bacterium]MBU4378812.1 LssY C-terminal domain-containing protein [Pseudomonadota bacterium]MBU4475530.1 LssY C-terminal domain-containing protein [Pseudomonadota bacterium]
MPKTARLTQLIVGFYERLSSWEHGVVRDTGVTLTRMHAQLTRDITAPLTDSERAALTAILEKMIREC